MRMIIIKYVFSDVKHFFYAEQLRALVIEGSRE
jgi:hypothetical protein